MERAKFRDLLKTEDWEAIFEELMRRDLIDLSESYIREEKFFNDPK